MKKKSDKLKKPNIFKKIFRKIKKHKTKFLMFILSILIIILGIIIAFILNNKNSIYTSGTIIEDKNTTFVNEIQMNFVSDENNETYEKIIGTLNIPSIGLKDVPIKDGVDMDTLNLYLGHFTNSNYLNGNVAICGHNRGYTKNYFSNLKNIKEKDLIYYNTKYGTQTYEVSEIKQIKETEVGVTNPSKENKITLITCVENKPELRLCVVGYEK